MDMMTSLQHRLSPLRIRSRHDLNGSNPVPQRIATAARRHQFPLNVVVEGCSFPIHTYVTCSTRAACRYKRWCVPDNMRFNSPLETETLQ